MIIKFFASAIPNILGTMGPFGVKIISMGEIKFSIMIALVMEVLGGVLKIVRRDGEETCLPAANTPPTGPSQRRRTVSTVHSHQGSGTNVGFIHMGSLWFLLKVMSDSWQHSGCSPTRHNGVSQARIL